MLQEEDALIRLTMREVDLLRRAKAAIGVGVGALLAGAGLAVDVIGRLSVGGASGRPLSVRHARTIGLLPGIRPECVELPGHTALAGCERLLLYPAAADGLTSIQRSMVLNLAEEPDSDRRSVENLYLQPFRVDEP